MLIIIGGLAVSGAGCIANDLWDHRIDASVARTSDRPLARGALTFTFAWTLLVLCLLTALLVVMEVSNNCLSGLALLVLVEGCDA